MAAGLVHIANVLLSYLSGMDKDKEEDNPCVWYFLNVSTTEFDGKRGQRSMCEGMFQFFEKTKWYKLACTPNLQTNKSGSVRCADVFKRALATCVLQTLRNYGSHCSKHDSLGTNYPSSF